MSWAQRRRATYLGGIFAVILIIVIIFAIKILSKSSTCFDGIKNQSEVGIDCGGPCTNLCRAEYSDLNVLWVRWAKVSSSGKYNVVAYIQNPNIGAGVLNLPYSFYIYDKTGVLLFEKSGSTYVPPSKNFAIFEDGVDIMDKIPSRISFVFNKNTVWQKMGSREIGISTISKVLSKEDTAPRLNVELNNKTLQDMDNVEVVAILYNDSDNAVAFSRTKIDSLKAETTQKVVFTWPEAFSSKVYKIEIVPKILGK